MTTRATLRSRARIRADQDRSTFPSDDQYNLLLDSAGKEAWFDLIQAGWPPFSEDWTVQADGSGSYDLGVPRSASMFTGSGPSGARNIAWLDNGNDPAEYNGAELYHTTHTGSPNWSLTIVEEPSIFLPGKTYRSLTISRSSNAMPAPTVGQLAATLQNSGVVEPVGPSWTLDAALGVSFTPGFAGLFSGGTAGSAPVFSVTGVWRLEGGQYHELARIREGDRPALMSNGDGRALAYEVTAGPDGAQLRVYPPAVTGTIKVTLVREWPGFTRDDSRWYGPARSDELVVLKAAAAGCRKEGNDQGARELDREYGLLLERVQNMAGWLHGRHATTIRDVGDPLGRSRLPGDFDVFGPDY